MDYRACRDLHHSFASCLDGPVAWGEARGEAISTWSGVILQIDNENSMQVTRQRVRHSRTTVAITNLSGSQADAPSQGNNLVLQKYTTGALIPYRSMGPQAQSLVRQIGRVSLVLHCPLINQHPLCTTCLKIEQ